MSPFLSKVYRRDIGTKRHKSRFPIALYKKMEGRIFVATATTLGL